MTHSIQSIFILLKQRRNEVLAREGIDTDLLRMLEEGLRRGRNEVLAREGIDTTFLIEVRRLTF